MNGFFVEAAVAAAVGDARPTVSLSGAVGDARSIVSLSGAEVMVETENGNVKGDGHAEE